ncbi:TonB-dependent receptor [Rufibacter sediminis]|uniref:TonB-dependent receptor n=1 Tax=Rufibacter sediminis TaxID=2762756 RepID=A0ABR6VYE7_9BACT|nr:TonB-dependent receptor [Rufibacter sediminis]MBC3542230.1 TonB-dependent receptor [Rufibacter sediminis]
MKKRYSSILLLLGMLTGPLSYAQIKVQGKVLDAITKEALVGATVRLGHSQTTSTQQDGSFSFLPPLTADSVTVTYLRYVPLAVTTARQPMTILMQPAANAINQVVVTASRQAQMRADAPVAISTISKQVMVDTKAVSLDQLLNKVSGVYMVNLGNEQHTMAIRQPIGYRSLFLYLEDGIPIRTSGDFNHNALIEINMAALKTIEVIRGPSSSLYGSEAIGGAVNFLTQSPSQIPTAALQVEASNRGYRRTEFSASNTIGKLGVYVGGYYARQRDGIMDHSDFDKLGLTLRADYRMNDRTKLTNSATLVDYQTDQTGGLDSTRFYGRQYASLHTFSYRKVNALRLRSTLEHTWDSTNSTALTGFFRHSSIGQNPFYSISNVAGNPLKAKGEINEDAFHSYGLNAQQRLALSFLDAHLTIGLSADYSPATYNAKFISVDRDETGVYTGYTPSDSLLIDYDVQLLNSAFYTQFEISPLKRLKLVAALRYDRLDYRFDNHLPSNAFTGAPDENNGFRNLSPKLGLTYGLSNNAGTYANYSVGFAPPQITELYRGVQVPTLRPSVYRNYEVGGWLSFAHQRGYLDVSAYHMDGTDEIISVRLADGSYQNQNAGQTRHRGIEYSISYSPLSSLTLRWGGTNAKHWFIDYQEKGVDFAGKEMATAPGFIGNAEVTFKPAFVPGLRLGLEWQHLGTYYTDQANTDTYRGYDVLNLRVGYTLKGFEAWVNALNATDRLYATTVEKSAFGKSFRKGAPCTFHFGVGYRFAARS